MRHATYPQVILGYKSWIIGGEFLIRGPKTERSTKRKGGNVSRGKGIFRIEDCNLSSRVE